MKFVVFGGILGDHPPKDRAKEFREQNFKQIRHLGKIQMTTDTAVMVSSEILELGKELASMKFIEEPEVPTDANTQSTLDNIFCIEKLASDQEPGFEPTQGAPYNNFAQAV